MLPCLHNNVAINVACNVDNVGMVGGLDEAPLLEAVEGKEAGGQAGKKHVPTVHQAPKRVQPHSVDLYELRLVSGPRALVRLPPLLY
jgi:hypothetical protein